jgi:hypothetical protein
MGIELERLHEEYVLVSVDKACNNIILFVRLNTTIVSEFGIGSGFGNPTCTPTAHSKGEILQNHRSVLDTFNILVNGMNESLLDS